MRPDASTQKVDFAQSLGWDKFKRDSKHLKIKIALMAERLAGKPAPEQACADWAIHFGAREFGAAAKKPISNLRQSRDSFEAVKLDVSPCSRVGQRFEALSSWHSSGRNSAMSNSRGTGKPSSGLARFRARKHSAECAG